MKGINSKRPTIWYQEAKEHVASALYGARIRVIYPNGEAEWFVLSKFQLFPDLENKYGDWLTPCWNETLSGLPKANDGKEAIKLMQRFDEMNNFNPAQFLGYL